MTLALPQDVQTEAWEYPEEMFAKRVWHMARPDPQGAVLERAVAMIRSAKRPLIIADGGALYSGATELLAHFAAVTGI